MDFKNVIGATAFALALLVTVFIGIECLREDDTAPIVTIDRYYCAYNWSNGKNKFGWGNATIYVSSSYCCVQDSLSAIIERADSSDEIILVNFIKLEK